MAGVTYDVLWNERRKAVCELRNMKIDSSYYGNYQRIALAIGTVYDGESFASECVRDRLIHLLGGDQSSGIDVMNSYEQRIEKLVEQRDEARQECADLLDLLRDAVVDFKNASYGWDYAAIVSENITMETERNRLAKERDELRRKVDELESFDPETSIAAFGDDNGKLRRMLSRAATLLANAEQDRDANYAYWMDCKEKVVHANVTIEELQAKLDAIRDALDG